MIKAIFFDFDGVIAESVDIKTNAFKKFFASDGKGAVRRVEEYHLKNTGVSRFEKFRYIYKEILKRELTEEVFQDLCQRFSRLVIDEVINAPYVRGAEEFLKDFSKLYKCYVVSATPQNEIEEIIIRKNIKDYFNGIFGAPQKKSDILKNVIEKEKLLPKEVLYIGDALSDYEAARANSVNFVARINSNNHIFKDIDCLKVKDLSGIRTIIEELARGLR